MTAPAGDTFLSAQPAQKTTLRSDLRRLRQLIPRAERARAARLTARHLLRWRRVRRAHAVAVYLPMRNELDTTALIDGLARAGTRLYAPRVARSGRMYFLPLVKRQRTRRDALGMQAPQATRPRRPARRLDLVIMPLLGFDACGNRIGMGAGYYDRSFGFRRIGARPWLIGYAYPQQQTGWILAEPWDVKLDAVALSTGVRRLNRGT
ncbi:MAG: 5-formyltetrahydrofolate cyclo-ligase [Nevskia sp.]|nr:5-formyltetrahydrofolate cyclo-ligase [Nevskia sp.]